MRLRAVARMFHLGGQCASEANRLREDVFGRAKRVRYAIEISFVRSSQSIFNFSVLRGKLVDFLLFNLLRPGPGATRLAGEPDFFENYSF